MMEHDVKVLNVRNREEFREWLCANHATATECWVRLKRGKPTDKQAFWYLDAVEEVLCFGWIDSTLKRVDGVPYQRFTRRRKGSKWSELNKARCRRMEQLGRMTEAGRAMYPQGMDAFVIDEDILAALQEDAVAWHNFCGFPALYQRIRIDTIQAKRAEPTVFASRLSKFIENTRNNVLFGEWNDYGRLS